jgi:excinuclease ABC subunit A
MLVVQMLQLQYRRENGIVPDEQIKDLIIQDFSNKRQISRPVIRARKGHYGELFQQIAGFLKVRVNGHVIDITSGMKLDRYKHTILRLWLIEWLLPTADNENA